MLSVPQGKPTDPTVPRFLSSVRESVYEDKLLDVTFTQVSGPGAGIEEELEKYLKPVTQQNSGSENSEHSQISLDKVYFGKTFQTEPSHPKSNSNSHRSTGSHGGSSGRSSVCGVKSDKSVVSVRSRNRGKGKLVMAGQSGSDGSDYLRRETP